MMKKLILLLCVATLLTISGSGVAHKPEPRLTEIEQSLVELNLIIDSLDNAYENGIIVSDGADIE